MGLMGWGAFTLWGGVLSPMGGNGLGVPLSYRVGGTQTLWGGSEPHRGYWGGGDLKGGGGDEALWGGSEFHRGYWGGGPLILQGGTQTL